VGAYVEKRDIGGSAGEDGGEHLVARLDTRKQESEMQRIGAGAHGHAPALEAEARAERRFELLDLRTLPDPAPVERVRPVLLRLAGDVRVEEYDALLRSHERQVALDRSGHARNATGKRCKPGRDYVCPLAASAPT